jgi:hypothetical protein
MGEGSVATNAMNMCACVSDERGLGECAGGHPTPLSDAP